MTNELLRTLRPAWIPVGILAATALAAWFVRLPDSLTGLITFGPSVVLAAGAAMAWRFNRAPAFVILASLLGAFGAYPATLVYFLVPLNALLAFVLPDRGVRFRAGYAWLALLTVEAAFVTALPDAPLILGRIMFAAAFAAAVWRAWPDFQPLQVGAAGALAAFYIAMEWTEMRGVYSAFMAAAGAILFISLLEESHSLAFRDTLTGLPGRRALEERLRSLGGSYTIAMVDIDYFKNFNDAHGHDVGDQVLKLVAARLAEVGGGGRAYRYGGEEFSVLFPRASLDEAMPHLEAIRRSVEEYRMAIRAPDRPKTGEDGTIRRGAGGSGKFVSVTVSIGASSPGGRRRTPTQVLKAADQALYRAKQSGRNRVNS